MSKTTARRALSFLIVGAMVLTGLLGLVTAAPVAAARSIESPVAPVTGVTNLPSANALPVPDEVPYWKIDPQLRDLLQAGSKGWSLVDIFTVQNSKLAPVLTKYGARSSAEFTAEERERRVLAPRTDSVAFRPTGQDGLPLLQRVWVPDAALAEIASLRGVLSVSRPLKPELTETPRLQTGLIDDDVSDPVQALRDRGITPTNYPSVVEHGSLQVQNDLGIDGSGVNIAIVDTTVDFGHPNLNGSWAVNQNASSPYFGWPMLLDSGTVLTNLELFTTASDFDRFPYPFFSTFGTSNANFFADTHYEIADADDGAVDGFLPYQYGLGGYAAREDPTGLSGKVLSHFMDRSYNVGTTGDPVVISSASGTYRLGILKDDYLTTIYGKPSLDYLFSTTNKYSTTVPSGVLSATWTVTGATSGARDVDFALFFDATCLGVYTIANFTAGSARTSGSNSESFTLDPAGATPVTAGCYVVHVSGFDVSAGSLVNIVFTTNTASSTTTTTFPNRVVTPYPYPGPLGRVGLLLVDSTTAGVYDTVYADLDFDLDFTDETPATRASPLLIRDMDGDGLTDISGGIVYFLSGTTSQVSGEVVAPFWDSENELTKAQLANGNLVADILPFGLFGAGGLELPTLALDGAYWPSAGEDVWEELIGAATGAEKGTSQSLTSGINILSSAAVDTSTLLQDYDLSAVYAVTLYNPTFTTAVDLEEGVDYEIDMDDGVITWLHNFPTNYVVEIIYELETWRIDFRTGVITFLANATAGSVIEASYQVGSPVPYADTLADRHGFDLFVPASGDLVGVYGAYDRETHGTGTSTTAAGVPVGLGGDGTTDTWGQAPGAKIISVDIFKPSSFGFDAWYYAVEGPDAVPDTGDEANIASNSWGWGDLPESGWEDWSRFKYFLNSQYAPNVTFVQSTGNDGQGYATESSPTASSSIQAGAAISADIYWLLGLAGGDQFTWPFGTGGLGPGPYGDVADFSSRGPNALGQPGPDVLGIGHGGIAGVPVNEFGNGQDAWDLFGGTSQAAPNLAGILALVYEGYESTHGQMPSGAVARSILKTTAQDVHRETVSQGSGFANAVRAVKAAMDMGGVTSDVHEWIPGDFNGVHRDMFLNFLEPGEGDSGTITLTNRGPSPATVTLSDGIYTRSGTYTFNWIHNNTASNFWVLNKTGVYRSHGVGFPGDTLQQGPTPDLATLWDNADFMKVWTYSDPAVSRASSILILYDWNDTNGNNVWNRLAEESLIGPFVFQGDSSGPRINSKVIHSPATRIHSGLGVRQTFFTGSNDPTKPIPTTLFVEFYQRADWSWLDVSPSSVNIPAFGTATVTATLDVPVGTAPASYDGAIYYTDGSNVSTIQVLVNVPVTSLPTNIGGGAVTGSLYQPNAFATGQMVSSGGDGRWIWFDTSALSASNRKMVHNLGWANVNSDAEILHFSALADADWTDDALFGPSTFELSRSTKRDAFATDTLERGWEFLASDVESGLFFLKVQSLKTTVPGEAFQGNLGIMTVNSDDIRVSSNDLSGVIPVTVSADVPLRSAIAVEPSGAVRTKTVTTTFAGEPVSSYPYTTGTYINYLFNAPDKTETVIPADARSAAWTLSFGSGATDVDMGIFFDVDCDGTYTVANDVLGSSGGSTLNNPETGSLAPATGQQTIPAGCYWVHAAGANVGAGGGQYDVDVDVAVPLVQGIGIAVTQASSTVEANLPVDSFPFPGGDFTAYLFSAPNRFVTEVPTGTIVASWSMFFHSGASDVDFGIFYDANCDGGYTAADSAVGTVAATGSNPEGASISFPTPGCYWVHAAGFTVPGSGAAYDLTFSLTILGESAYVPTGIPEATIPANDAVEMGVTWEFPSSKAEEVTTDFLFVGPGNAPFALAQSVAVRFSYDLTPPALAAQLPAPGSIVSDPFVGIFAQFSDTQAGSFANTGEIDQSTLRIWVDGTDVTSLATVSAPHVTNVGYPEGIILFSPSQALTNGAHTVAVEGGDFAGNVQSASWTFTVDTAAPTLTIDSPTPGFATSATSVTLIGHTEFGAAVTVSGQLVVVDSAGQFTTAVSLIEGTNTIDVSVVDSAGNVATTSVVVIRDTGLPAISLLRSSAGLLTNKDLTVVSGVVSEAASMTVAGVPAMVHVDGSFEAPVRLVEGPNTIAFVARDAAGNQATVSLTVVRDSTPPTVSIDALPTEVSTASITVTGAVESGIGFVTVNGQPVTVSGGRYTATVALSFGSNVIFVEATDAAGNSAVTSRAVSYVPQGVSTASIGLILLPVLTVIALLAGLAIGQARGGRGGGGGGGGEGGKKMEEMKKEEGATAEEELPPPEGGEL